MKWANLVGKIRAQPTLGTWREWKQHIADHCQGQCVYCAISEGRFGGIRNFHLEHFRPKSKFPKLENDINNLYLACSICNVLKCDDWPGECSPDHSCVAYPDPATTDYNALLLVSPQTHEVTSKKAAGKYVVERLLLNRYQLLIERRLRALLRALDEFQNWAESSLAAFTPEELRTIMPILIGLGRVATRVPYARPYDDGDTKRKSHPKGSKKRS